MLKVVNHKAETALEITESFFDKADAGQNKETLWTMLELSVRSEQLKYLSELQRANLVCTVRRTVELMDSLEKALRE